MRLISATILVASFALAGCVTDDGSATSSAPATVIDPLVGKQLVGDNVTFIINADGTMGGSLNGEPVVGTYEANAKESCSVYTSPKALVGREFCSTPVITGNTVIFNRRDGSQSQVYVIKG